MVGRSCASTVCHLLVYTVGLVRRKTFAKNGKKIKIKTLTLVNVTNDKNAKRGEIFFVKTESQNVMCGYKGRTNVCELSNFYFFLLQNPKVTQSCVSFFKVSIYFFFLSAAVYQNITSSCL